ncbi:peptidase S41 family protein ustP [Colletotrichum spaethianum]|uniref:Peptidase S41 family protein ustP n=1 Tax=Colletotrichum spaethianum TaxID=700344 RepID=A0AA37PCJ7_9PEZI|nr:peptidase S41 family protein ustP [Colletotrichum spaethianum]GKT49704.1 peptidase S41 family protein ustP [Colletotrichum spaethianum]
MKIPAIKTSATVLALATRVASSVYCDSDDCAQNQPVGTPTSTAACSTVSALWAAQITATPKPTVIAKLAYDCINSVPLNKPAALRWIDELKPYLEWQSTLAFLKTPPPEYFFPPHDIVAALDTIRVDLEAGKYPNEYSWQRDVFVKVFGPAHDGHLYVNPDILTNAMEWVRPLALVSISEDGTSPPVIKVYDDVASNPETASILSLINGVDAATFLKDQIFAITGSQDPDAAYNSMFYSKSSAVSNNAGFFKQGGRTRYIYPGETTSFTFENGTYLELLNIARLKGDWNGVKDGTSFFSKFAPGAGLANSTLVSTSSAAHTSTPTTMSPTSPTGVKGYPSPVVISRDSVVSGYFIDEPGFEDVAVLAVMSFGSDSPAEFQKVIEDFFLRAINASKTKLIVDLQFNYGGYIFQGYDTCVVKAHLLLRGPCPALYSSLLFIY